MAERWRVAQPAEAPYLVAPEILAGRAGWLAQPPKRAKQRGPFPSETQLPQGEIADWGPEWSATQALYSPRGGLGGLKPGGGVLYYKNGFIFFVGTKNGADLSTLDFRFLSLGAN